MIPSSVSKTHCSVKQALITLRDYQENLKNDIYKEWDAGHKNVLAVLPTGGGKTILFGRVVFDYSRSPVCVIAHRQELVMQISLALAKYGIRHDILAPKNVIKMIVTKHVKQLGISYYSAGSKVRVAGVDTLIARQNQPSIKEWANTVKTWVQDEAHHVLAKNKWGKACDLFPNSRGLGVTATPERTDGKGLGRKYAGVFDAMAIGPSFRDLVDMGYLTDYKIYAPPSDVDFSGLKTTAKGDYNRDKLREREKNSHIVGDVVEHYKKLIWGKLTVTFASNVKTAAELAQEFSAKGVPAAMVCGSTKDKDREEMTAQFERRELLQLTNVEIFGEGYDLPAIDAVQMVRKTESFSWFVQMAGRGARPVYAPNMPLDTAEQRKAAIAAGPKPVFYIVDHVGNVHRHAVCRDGVIDIAYRDWTLAGRDGRASKEHDPDKIPVKTCAKCAAIFNMFLNACPECGEVDKPVERKEPKHVDGDLTELDPSALKQIQSEVAKIGGLCPTKGDSQVARAIQKNHYARQDAQHHLKHAADQWAGYQKALGRDTKEAYKRFYYQFGIDVLTAQTQSAKKMTELTQKVLENTRELHEQYEGLNHE